MKHFQYSIIGGIIGLIVGTLFGLVCDSFYTKKSQLETKQTLQVYIFGGVGVLAGIALGIKIADEEEVIKQKQLDEQRRKTAYEEQLKQKQIEYRESFIQTKCSFCEDFFKYSYLQFIDKKYCDICILKIKNDYFQKCQEIDKIVSGIEQLKRQSAINARWDKVKEIAENVIQYENVELDFYFKKTICNFKKLEEYRLNSK